MENHLNGGAETLDTVYEVWNLLLLLPHLYSLLPLSNGQYPMLARAPDSCAHWVP